MINKHWIIQVIFVGVVVFFDYTTGSPFVSFFVASLYFLGVLISLIKRDKYLINRRLAYMVLFILLGVSTVALADADPTIDLDGFIESMVDDIWPG